MREILFKAKNLRNKWVYGYYWTNELGNYFIKQTIKEGEKYSKYTIEDIEVIPETICEYTGLNDKNGVKIFENDKLNLFDTIGDIMEQVIIKWNIEAASYEILQLNGNHYSFDYRCVLVGCKKVGNIFDEEVK